MLPDYADITALASRPPYWWDGHGVPRYKAFDPDMLGVYDKFAVLAQVGCQGCRNRFYVGVGVPHFTTWPESEEWTLDRLADGFHYGDPPRHGGCVGETMQSEPLRIIEAWAQNADHEWVRSHKHEKDIDDE